MVFLHTMQEFGTLRMDEIAAFLAVIDKGSFAEASRSLNRDASVLSRRVSALERRLGVRLIERTTRSIVLTDVGARYAERMRAAIAAMREAELEAADAAHQPGGTLRIALPGAFGRLWVAPRLPEFLAAHPRVRLDATYSDRFVDLVAEEFDLALRIGALPDSRLIARKLADHRRLVCAAPSYLERRGEPSSPADLARHDCLQFTRHAAYPHWRFRRDGRSESVAVAGAMEADDAESLLPATLAGHGILLCSDWLVGHHLAEGRLVRVLEGWSVEGEGAIHLLRPSARFTAAKVRLFADWIARCLSPPPWAAPFPQPGPRPCPVPAQTEGSR